MSGRTTRKTFAEFWGELLLVRFHAGSDDFGRYNAQRQAMVFRYLPDRTSPRILDLGCGSGDLSLCLADHGATVTAVDRIGPVLEMARRKTGTRTVRFLDGDLRHLSLPASSFDAALLLGVAGLMSREDDASLLARCREWLAPGGVVLVDAPREPVEDFHEWTRQFEDGVLTFRSEYDRPARLMHITPTFRTADGELIALYDPYDPAHADDRTGVLRYLYSPAELTELLKAAGFAVTEGEHCSSADHNLLVGGMGDAG